MADERILRVGVQVDEALGNLDRLEKKFTSTGAAAGKIADGAQKSESVFAKLGLTLRNTISGSIFTGLAVGLGNAVKKAIEFDDAMLEIAASTKTTAREMGALEKGIRDISDRTSEPMSELAGSLTEIKRAGFEGAEALEILNLASQAAESGFGKTTQVANIVTTAMRIYGEANLDAGDATGILIKSLQEGRVEIGQLERALGRTGPIAKSLGIEFHELAGAFAFLANRGGQAGQASQALSTILATLSDPSDKAAIVLDRNGVAAEKLRATIADRGLLAALQQLKEGLGNNQSEIKALFPEARTLGAVLALLNDDTGALNDTMEELAGAGAKDVVDAFGRTAGASREFKTAMNQLDNVFLDIGLTWLPTITTVFETLNEFLKDTKVFAENTGRVVAEIFNSDLSVDLIDNLEKSLAKAQAAKDRFVALGPLKQEEKDRWAASLGFPTEASIDASVTKYQKALDLARKELRDTNKRFIDELLDDIGTQSAAAYRKAIEPIANARDKKGLNQTLGNLLYTDEQVENARRQVFILDNLDEELFERARERRDKALVVQEIDTKTLPPKKAVRPAVLFDERELSKIESLVSKYDEFNSKVKELSGSFALLNKGVAGGKISAAEAAASYGGMLEDVAGLATRTDSFSEALKNTETSVNLLSTAVDKYNFSSEASRIAQEGMLDGLGRLALEADTFEGKISQSGAVMEAWVKSVSSGGASSELARIKIAGMVSSLAGAATETGVFADAVRNGNVVLDVMKELVRSGNLDLQVAKEVYKELGLEILSLHPNIEANLRTQAAWNTLIASGRTPIEEYEERVKQLADAYALVAKDGEEGARAQLLFSRSVIAAATDLNAELSKLTPEEEKLRSAIDRVSQASANAFSSMIQDARGFDDVLNGLLRSIQDVIVQLLILEPIKQAITTGLVSTFNLGGPAPGAPGSSIPPPTNAGGGPVRGGIRYQVGEEGPELLVSSFDRRSAILVGQRGPEYIVAPPGGGLVLSNRETRKIIDQQPEERQIQIKKSMLMPTLESRVDPKPKRKVSPPIIIHTEKTLVESVKKGVRAFSKLEDELEKPEKRASGGSVSGGSRYLVGEEGPELILTGQSNQSREALRSPSIKVDVNVPPVQSSTVINIQNNTGEEATQTSRKNNQGLEVIDIVIGAVTRNIDERGSISKSIDRRNRLIRR